jgi:hypothetical protein
VDNVLKDIYEVDEINQNSIDIECLLARQHTLLWNKDKYLEIAPGQNKPLTNIYNVEAQDLLFLSIYLGQDRTFKSNTKVTQFMMATGIIRHKDRRGVTPQRILYMAMKILRHRVRDGFYATFRSVGETEHITKRMMEDKKYLEAANVIDFSPVWIYHPGGVASSPILITLQCDSYPTNRNLRYVNAANEIDFSAVWIYHSGGVASSRLLTSLQCDSHLPDGNLRYVSVK